MKIKRNKTVHIIVNGSIISENFIKSNLIYLSKNDVTKITKIEIDKYEKELGIEKIYWEIPTDLYIIVNCLEC